MLKNFIDSKFDGDVDAVAALYNDKISLALKEATKWQVDYKKSFVRAWKENYSLLWHEHFPDKDIENDYKAVYESIMRKKSLAEYRYID